MTYIEIFTPTYLLYNSYSRLPENLADKACPVALELVIELLASYGERIQYSIFGSVITYRSPILNRVIRKLNDLVRVPVYIQMYCRPEFARSPKIRALRIGYEFKENLGKSLKSLQCIDFLLLGNISELKKNERTGSNESKR